MRSKKGDGLDLDLEQGEIVIGIDADNGGGVLAAGAGQEDANAGGIGDDVGVGDEVAIGSDKEAGTAAALGHQNPGGLFVAGSSHFK